VKCYITCPKVSSFKSLAETVDFDRHNLMVVRECLFVPKDVSVGSTVMVTVIRTFNHSTCNGGCTDQFLISLVIKSAGYKVGHPDG
jgi:hypothetical protein